MVQFRDESLARPTPYHVASQSGYWRNHTGGELAAGSRIPRALYPSHRPRATSPPSRLSTLAAALPRIYTAAGHASNMDPERSLDGSARRPLLLRNAQNNPASAAVTLAMSIGNPSSSSAAASASSSSRAASNVNARSALQSPPQAPTSRFPPNPFFGDRIYDREAGGRSSSGESSRVAGYSSAYADDESDVERARNLLARLVAAGDHLNAVSSQRGRSETVPNIASMQATPRDNSNRAQFAHPARFMMPTGFHGPTVQHMAALPDPYLLTNIPTQRELAQSLASQRQSLNSRQPRESSAGLRLRTSSAHQLASEALRQRHILTQEEQENFYRQAISGFQEYLNHMSLFNWNQSHISIEDNLMAELFERRAETPEDENENEDNSYENEDDNEEVDGDEDIEDEDDNNVVDDDDEGGTGADDEESERSGIRIGGVFHPYPVRLRFDSTVGRMVVVSRGGDDTSDDDADANTLVTVPLGRTFLRQSGGRVPQGMPAPQLPSSMHRARTLHNFGYYDTGLGDDGISMPSVNTPARATARDAYEAPITRNDETPSREIHQAQTMRYRSDSSSGNNGGASSLRLTVADLAERDPYAAHTTWSEVCAVASREQDKIGKRSLSSDAQHILPFTKKFQPEPIR